MVKGTGLEDIKLDRRKGQYILKDRDVISRQVDYAGLTGEETVLEIGPGLGALTFKLAEKAAKVLAIEKDRRLYSYLKDKIPSNVELITSPSSAVFRSISVTSSGRSSIRRTINFTSG